MATPEERQERLDNVKKQIEELAAIDAKTLSRTEDLSHDINFSEAVPFFEEMLDIIKQLNDRDISRLSVPQLDKINKACTILSNLVQKINDFTLNQDRPADICTQILTEIKNSYDNVMEPLLLPLAFTATQATDYAKIEREAKGYHTTMQEEYDKLLQFVETVKKDASKALSAVQEQAAEAGVSTNAQIFLENAKTHSTQSKTWLKATITISSITLLVAIGFLINSFIYKPLNVSQVVQYVVSKIIVLSTFSFGIFWCAKNFKAQKHNETLNQHRANALMTFRAFVEGTDDLRIKDAILLQAAQAAFSSRATGFDTPEKDIQSVNPIVEVLGKSISKSQSSEG